MAGLTLAHLIIPDGGVETVPVDANLDRLHRISEMVPGPQSRQTVAGGRSQESRRASFLQGYTGLEELRWLT